MSAVPRQQFTPAEVATVAAALALQPVNLAQQKPFNVLCKMAYNLLVSAQQFLEQREALIAAGKVEDETQHPTRAETYKRSVHPPDIIPPAVRVAE